MTQASDAQLTLLAGSARLRAEAQRREKALRRIARKREELRTLKEQTRDAGSTMEREVLPLLQEAGKLSQALVTMFEALTADEKRPKRQRKEIAQLYRYLVGSGLFAGLDLLEPIQPFAAEVAHSRAHDDPEPRFVESSDPRPAGTNHEAVRALFRRLADALHPDKTPDEVEKAARTEAMKRLTVAYREGDYAKLLELERALGVAAPPPDEPDEYEALVRSNAALRKQERALDKELRALRAMGAGDPTAALQEARDALADLQRIHDFVASFRDGKISYEAFRAGPTPPDPSDADDVDELMMDLFHVLSSELASGRRGPRRRW